MPSPDKITRKPSNYRSPRSTIRKGDALGKNKVQKTLDQYFSPSPVKSERKPLIAQKSKRKLFSEVPTSESIVISDDDSPRVRTMESYYVQTKNIPLKTRKTKTIESFAASSSLAGVSNNSENESSVILDEFDSQELFSPKKSFKKQIVMSPGSDDDSKASVLKVIALNNKPSFLSTKSRKRKSPVTTKVTSAEKKLKSDECVCSDFDLSSRAECAIKRTAKSEGVKNEGGVGVRVKPSRPKEAAELQATDSFRSSTDLKELSVDRNSATTSVKLPVVDDDLENHRVDSPQSSSKSPPVARRLFRDEVMKIQQNRPTCIVSPKAPDASNTLVDDIDWSEPMEAEIRFGTPVKRESADTTSISPSKTSNSALLPSTSKKVMATPTKNTPVGQLPAASPTKATPQSSPSKSPKGRAMVKSPRRSPKKGTPVKTDFDVIGGNTMFIHCIQECRRYAQMVFTFNARNKKVAEDYLNLQLPEKIVLFKLLMRKWSWIREIDMKYEKIAHNQIVSLNVLKDHGFLEDMSQEEELDVVLGELKRPELADLCKSFKLDNLGTKAQLADRLFKFATRQGGLGFSTSSLKMKMQTTAFSKLGTCVRVAAAPREVLQQIFEASVSPLYLQGQFYTFQERLRAMEQLLNSVKFDGKKLVPFKLTDEQLFKTTAQLDEYLTSVKLKFEILAARDRKDTEKGIELARDARASLLIYVCSEAVQEFLDKTPRFIWRYTAGSNYTSALDVGIDFFKRVKDYETALLALDVLLGQGRFRKHCRGHWYAEKALILEKHLKRSVMDVYNVVLRGLREDLTPLGRLELSRKAENLINKKKNGLSVQEKEEMRKLMRIPKLRHSVKEIKSTEAPNMGTGTRQTFVEVSVTGDKVYSNVEETAKNSYMGEYPEGLHDEGSFLKNIILAAFWPVIYAPQDAVFLSKYQQCPLDWGTQAFYNNRRSLIDEHVKRLEEGGVDGVMEQITTVVTVYLDHYSLVNWKYVCFDMLPTIKNLLTCLSLPKFLLLSRYLLESFRERRSGWPDLTLWNTVTKKFKFVEVKSPNDELSFKQIVWLEKFAEMGIDVEECHVNASNKGKRRKAQMTQYSDASQEL